MKNFSKLDHTRLLRAASHPKVTDDEKTLLGYCASMCAAGEPVEDHQFKNATEIALNDWSDKNLWNRP